MTRLALLTQSDCHACDTLKDIVADLADEFVFDVDLVDLAMPDGEQLAVRHGVAWAPGLLIDDTLVTYGRPSARRIRKELERRGALRHNPAPLTHRNRPVLPATKGTP